MKAVVKMTKPNQFQKNHVSYKESQRCNKLARYGSHIEQEPQKTPEQVITESFRDMAAIKLKVVFTNGCFDIIHPGHILALKVAKGYGDKLIVGLNSDESVRKIKPGRPFNNQEDRKAVLEAIKYVDEVIIFNESTPLELIKKIKPDVLVKGNEYKLYDIVGHDIVPEVFQAPMTKHSTTKLIEKIQAAK
jgi:rfaE bifunctional protein nucleotidyltransferase chain/domain